MVKKDLQIHSENILPIIKKWLYSDRDIFLRELISNACDALQKAKILLDRGEATAKNEPRIDVRIDKNLKTLTISDTGIGMNAEEVEKYLAQIAFSGAEEFIKTYQASDTFIGHFGLGFYSAYMVASHVEVHTLSLVKSEKSVLFQCDGTSGYEIETGSKNSHGTDIILHIDKENEEYLEEKKIRELIRRYSFFLPFSIYLNDIKVTEEEPLWLKSPHECTKEDYVHFFRTLYPFENEPLFWVHLNVDFPFTIRGILYFPHIGPDFNFQKSRVQLYSNRVFVSEDTSSLLPEYLTMLQGALDSPDIPLNVSRSYLQVDKTVRGIANHISKKIADALLNLFKQEKERFLSIWEDIEIIVKLGALQDDKFFKQIKELLVFKTTRGDFLSVEEWQKKHNSQKTIFYTNTPHVSELLTKIYEEKNLDIFVAPSAIDSALMSHLEKHYSDIKFKRIDAECQDFLMDPSKEKTLLDEEGKTESTHMADFVRKALQETGVEVQAKSMASERLPGLLVIPEEDRRFRDFMQRTSKTAGDSFPMKKSYIVNTNSPLMQKLYAYSKKNPALAEKMCKSVYDLLLLSQREMDPSKVHNFIDNTLDLFTTITKAL